ncbi:MAG: alpha/beta hydrolase, partial [Eudoraea sp.]|nr:alpha/beta hydrolase [Eudoraea sp.]
MKSLLLFILLAIFSLNIYAQQQDLRAEGMDWLPIRPDVKAGSLWVPENHDNPGGKKIEIAYIILKARDTTVQHFPLIFFSGGPGGNTLVPGLVNFILEQPMRQERDIILFDQRGIGYSSALPDMSFDSFHIMAKNVNEAEELILNRQMIGEFQERCKAENINPAYYNTHQSAQDVGLLFAHLGYGKYNLLGGSYGTRLARVVQDFFPEYIHSSVLDSPAPMSGDFLLNRLDSFSLALGRIFDYCKGNENCNTQYPNLIKDYFEAINKLKTTPLTTKMGDTLEVTINAQDGIYLLRRLLYQNNSREKAPELIHAYLKGEGEVIQEVLQAEYFLTGGLNLSMLLSVEKYENFNRANTAEVIEDHYKKYPYLPVKLGFLDAFYQAGMEWHEANLPIEERQFKISHIPTLILVNQFDPVT